VIEPSALILFLTYNELDCNSLLTVSFLFEVTSLLKAVCAEIFNVPLVMLVVEPPKF
jgi:hypothetical protein